MKRILLLAVVVLVAWFAYSEIDGSGDAGVAVLVETRNRRPAAAPLVMRTK